MVKIKNIYYMLTYAFRVLNKESYKKIDAEAFHSVGDLLATILIKGVNSQVKRGLERDYIDTTKALASPKGKINIIQTINTQSQLKSRLVCNYEIYSENTYMNQILKTTIVHLLNNSAISIQYKRELRKLLMYFANVQQIDTRTIDWSRLSYARNNVTYKMLMNICTFVLDSLLHTGEEGKYKVAKFIDDQKLYRLFERFVFEYYRKHFPNYSVTAPYIEWQVDGESPDALPTMQTDIVLRAGEKTLIIDTKFYSRTMQQSYNKKTFHSSNLYQIFSYVKNEDKMNTGNVGGMLLYAKTDEDVTPDDTFTLSGNQIQVKTLDLNIEFEGIKKQLNDFVESFFGDTAIK